MKNRTLTEQDRPGGMLVAAIEHNKRPPNGHPDERWFKQKYPYQYLGEETNRVYNAPKVRGGGRKARRTANKGSVAGGQIIPGGLKYGAKHGKLSKEKIQNRHHFGLKDEGNKKNGS